MSCHWRQNTVIRVITAAKAAITRWNETKLSTAQRCNCSPISDDSVLFSACGEIIFFQKIKITPSHVARTSQCPSDKNARNDWCASLVHFLAVTHDLLWRALPVPGNGNHGNYRNYHGNYPITGGEMGAVTGFSDMPNEVKRGNCGNYPVIAR